MQCTGELNLYLSLTILSKIGFLPAVGIDCCCRPAKLIRFFPVQDIATLSCSGQEMRIYQMCRISAEDAISGRAAPSPGPIRLPSVLASQDRWLIGGSRPGPGHRTSCCQDTLRTILSRAGFRLCTGSGWDQEDPSAGILPGGPPGYFRRRPHFIVVVDEYFTLAPALMSDNEPSNIIGEYAAVHHTDPNFDKY
jgi:hypothetical protein